MPALLSLRQSEQKSYKWYLSIDRLLQAAADRCGLFKLAGILSALLLLGVRAATTGAEAPGNDESARDRDYVYDGAVDRAATSGVEVAPTQATSEPVAGTPWQASHLDKMAMHHQEFKPVICFEMLHLCHKLPTLRVST